MNGHHDSASPRYASADQPSPANTLLRSIIEYAARAFWILNPQVDHVARCARAHLFELISLHHARDAAPNVPGDTELQAQRTAAKAQFKLLKEVAAQRFPEVDCTGDVTRWTIASQAYPSWTDAVADWAEAYGTGVDGAHLYKLISVLGHPQGYSATFGLRFDVDGTSTQPTDIARVEKLTVVAINGFYATLTLMANYTGHRPQALVDWEDGIERARAARIFAELPRNAAEDSVAG
jgi:hypothetical protein